MVFLSFYIGFIVNPKGAHIYCYKLYLLNIIKKVAGVYHALICE